MSNTHMAPETKLSRWEDQRDVMNLMGRYTYELLLKNQGSIYDKFWTRTQEPCLGFNNGYYKGESAVRGYYDAVSRLTGLKSRLLAEKFPDKLGGMDEQTLYGVGQIDFKPLTSPYVVISGDGMTAKGMWLAQGNYGDLTAAGPENFWTFGCFAGDFIREDEEWKIMHLLYVEDVNASMGSPWDAGEKRVSLPEFQALEDFEMPSPNVPATVYSEYDAHRPYALLPEIPRGYETFAETFSYGV